MVKSIKYIKLVLYILCFSSLALPMNYSGHGGEWIFGISYIVDLFNIGPEKEELYWFLYYFGLFILPVTVEILFWTFSKRGIVSDVFDIMIGTACSALMFCFFISFRRSPAGIMVVIVLQILIVAMGCVGLISKVFSQQSFEDLILNKFEKTRKKCNFCGKIIKQGKVCPCKKNDVKNNVRNIKLSDSIDIDL